MSYVPRPPNRKKGASAPHDEGGTLSCPYHRPGDRRDVVEDQRHSRPASGREPALTAIWYRCADGHYSLRKVTR